MLTPSVRRIFVFLLCLVDRFEVERPIDRPYQLFGFFLGIAQFLGSIDRISKAGVVTPFLPVPHIALNQLPNILGLIAARLALYISPNAFRQRDGYLAGNAQCRPSHNLIFWPGQKPKAAIRAQDKGFFAPLKINNVICPAAIHTLHCKSSFPLCYYHNNIKLPKVKRYFWFLLPFQKLPYGFLADQPFNAYLLAFNAAFFKVLSDQVRGIMETRRNKCATKGPPLPVSRERSDNLLSIHRAVILIPSSIYGMTKRKHR